MIGSMLGCILGGLGAWYLEVHGWSMAALGDSMQKISQSMYPIKDVFYAELSVDALVMTFVLGTFISVAASYFPARKAARMNPVEALRHI